MWKHQGVVAGTGKKSWMSIKKIGMDVWKYEGSVYDKKEIPFMMLLPL